MSVNADRCVCPEDHLTLDRLCANPPLGDEPVPRGLCACCMADCPEVHGPDGRLPGHYAYAVEWSEEDQTFVGVVTEFPSLSALAPTPHEALAGIRSVVLAVLSEMARTGEEPPVPITTE